MQHSSSSFLLLVGFVVAVVLLLLRALRGSPRLALLYRSKPLLTAWERKVLPLLLEQLPPGCHLCPQVRLADLLAITTKDPSARTTALNRVASKSVDFAIVDLTTGAVRLVVELDDKTHDRPDRQARDGFVGEVLRAAGIPVARFRPRQPIDLRPHLESTVAFGHGPRGSSIADRAQRLAPLMTTSDPSLESGAIENSASAPRIGLYSLRSPSRCASWPMRVTIPWRRARRR